MGARGYWCMVHGCPSAVQCMYAGHKVMARINQATPSTSYKLHKDPEKKYQVRSGPINPKSPKPEPSNTVQRTKSTCLEPGLIWFDHVLLALSYCLCSGGVFIPDVLVMQKRRGDTLSFTGRRGGKVKRKGGGDASTAQA